MKQFILSVIMLITGLSNSHADSGFNFYPSSAVSVGVISGDASNLTNIPVGEVAEVLIASTTITVSTGVVTFNGLSISSTTYSGITLSYDILVGSGAIIMSQDMYTWINNVNSTTSYTGNRISITPTTATCDVIELEARIHLFFKNDLLHRYGDATEVPIGYCYNSGVLTQGYLFGYAFQTGFSVGTVSSLSFTYAPVNGVEMIGNGSTFSIHATPR
jgi:hypothetical protein